MLMKTCMISLLKSIHIQCAWNPLWKCVSLWLSKSFGRYANIENNNDDDDDGDGDGDGDDDPCKNALTAPEKHIKMSFNIWLLYFLKFSTCHNEQHDLKIIHIFINTQQIFMLNLSI